MTPGLSRTQFWLRILALFLGAGLLIWLPFEDTRDSWAVLFAAAISAWIAAVALSRFLAKIPERRPSVLFAVLLVGTVAGLAVAPLASFLMIFKIGLHGHQAPDFTPDQIVSVLRRIPIFVLSGLLSGFGSALAILAKSA